MKKLYVATAALLASTAIVSMPALAADDSTAKQIQMLKEQLRAMQQQLDALQSNTQDAVAKETAAREAYEKDQQKKALEAGGRLVFNNGKAEVLPPANPKVVESSSHKFSLSSADGNWTIGPTGRIHFDFGGYLSQKPEGTTGIGTAAGGRMTGGVNLRRARLGIQGKAMGDFEYSLILDAGGANDGVPAGGSNGLINQAKIAYVGMKNTAFEIGYFAQYFTMDEATSSNDIMFIERSTPTTVAAAIGAGDPRGAVGFKHWDSNYWVGAYLTASAPGDVHALTTRRLGAYERATYQVYDKGLNSIHIGGAAFQSIKVPGAGANPSFGTYTLSDRPELRVDPSTPLSTGALGTAANPVTGIQVYNVETAANWGSFYAQGEWVWINVDRLNRPQASFNGGYVEASYTFGGRRSYKAADGVYSGVTPVENFSPKSGGMGAIEIAGRVSQLDLTDLYNPNLTAAAQPGFVNGGRQTSYTVGINWYWNPYMLWKVNYIHTVLDKVNPAATAGAGGTLGGLTLDAIGVRWQVMY